MPQCLDDITTRVFLITSSSRLLVSHLRYIDVDGVASVEVELRVECQVSGLITKGVLLSAVLIKILS